MFKVAFQKIAETFGGVDIFCNNAGILNEIQWQKTVSINLVRKCPSFLLPEGGWFWLRCVAGVCHQRQLPGSGAHEQAERWPRRCHCQHILHGRRVQSADIASQNVSGVFDPLTPQGSVLCPHVLSIRPPSTDCWASPEPWRWGHAAHYLSTWRSAALYFSSLNRLPPEHRATACASTRSVPVLSKRSSSPAARPDWDSSPIWLTRPCSLQKRLGS